MKTAAVAVTETGAVLARLLRDSLPDCGFFHPGKGELSSLTARLFREYEGIVFVMAAGIASRMIAPHVESKHRDPAVVVLDDAARFAVSLLSGHEGGANRLAYEVAAASGALPVITTASETVRRVTLGIGCRRGVSAEEVEAAVRAALAAHGVAPGEVRLAASADIKRGEAGLLEACRRLDLPLLFFAGWEIRRLREDYRVSAAAERNLDLPGVSEPCALLAGRDSRLLGPRTVLGRVTVAVARENAGAGPAAGPAAGGSVPVWNAAEPARTAQSGRGALTVVGMGPGDPGLIAPRAGRAIADSDLLVGYTRYIRLLGSLADGKETFATGMRREEERTGYAVEAARSGRRVVLVSSGDAGIYGLAGLALETLSDEDLENIDFRVVPGITAASSCAALLGAPLTHDFAVISLSDLLTGRELIEKRLRLAAEGDFVTVLYNPRSTRRKDLLEWTQELFLEHRGEGTPVGIVRASGRAEEWVRVTTLGELPDLYGEIEMTTTVIIGSSRTFTKGRFMVTPRGYRGKIDRSPPFRLP